MFAEHCFTSLRDVSTKRFHIWPASHSMLLPIFGMHLIACWSIHSSMYAIYHIVGSKTIAIFGSF
jgi:hypothetical protein